MKYIVIIAALTVSACATRPPMTPEEQRISDECKYEAAKVSGYDWIDAIIQRDNVYKQCMALRAPK